ncbi:MAG: DUF4330 family protein [Oscillospiraceae bacterium]|jgi:hypothetical protein|nr:DUF4330 family protein [Oscillospiraceae bacterium]
MPEQTPKKKRKLKIGVLDIIIIAVVVVAAVFAYKFLTTRGTLDSMINDAAKGAVQGTIELSSPLVFEESDMIPAAGDKLYLRGEDGAFVTVLTVDTSPYREFRFNPETGEYAQIAVPGLKSVTLTVSAQMYVYDAAVRITQDQAAVVGRDMRLTFGGQQLVFEVVRVDYPGDLTNE